MHFSPPPPSCLIILFLSLIATITLLSVPPYISPLSSSSSPPPPLLIHSSLPPPLSVPHPPSSLSPPPFLYHTLSVVMSGDEAAQMRCSGLIYRPGNPLALPLHPPTPASSTARRYLLVVSPRCRPPDPLAPCGRRCSAEPAASSFRRPRRQQLAYTGNSTPSGRGAGSGQTALLFHRGGSLAVCIQTRGVCVILRAWFLHCCFAYGMVH